MIVKGQSSTNAANRLLAPETKEQPREQGSADRLLWVFTAFEHTLQKIKIDMEPPWFPKENYLRVVDVCLRWFAEGYPEPMRPKQVQDLINMSCAPACFTSGFRSDMMLVHKNTWFFPRIGLQGPRGTTIHLDDLFRNGLTSIRPVGNDSP